MNVACLLTIKFFILNVYYLNNNLNNNEYIEIDTRLANIIKLGIDFYDTTDGLFNVAAGNLTIKWKECESM